MMKYSSLNYSLAVYLKYKSELWFAINTKFFALKKGTCYRASLACHQLYGQYSANYFGNTVYFHVQKLFN